jgi:hypothetical protein
VRVRLSYPCVVSTLALVIAVGGGGTAWAVAVAHHHYLITSTSEIKPSVIQHLRGHDGADGAPGPAGPAGPAGAPGIANIVVATSGSQSMVGSPTLVAAKAPSTGTFLAVAQVAGEITGPQGDGALLCSIIDLTAAPGTNLFTAAATPAKETSADSFVDVVVQGPVTATAGDSIAVKCVPFIDAPNATSPQASIVLLPEP